MTWKPSRDFNNKGSANRNYIIEEMVPIAELDKTGTQIRETLSEATVAQYVEDMQDGANFPPAVVFWDGKKPILAAGFHRVEATLRTGKMEIFCRIKEGGFPEAIIEAIKSNREHGLPMTLADKRKAATKLMSDKKYGGWSNREIARLVGISHSTVESLRTENDSSLAKSSSEDGRRFTSKHGSEATMDTSKIVEANKRRAKVNKTEPTPVEVPATPPEIANVEPEEELSPVDQALANGKLWDRAKRHLESDVWAMFTALNKVPGGAFLDDNKLQEVKGKIANLVEVLRDTKPYAECPYCKSGCKACRNSGYVPQHIHRNAPKKGDGK